MKRMKSFVLAASAIASSVAVAVVFPDTDGSHDVGSAAAWGGDRPSGQQIEVNKAGTYYLGSDYNVGARFWTVGAAGTTVYDFTRDGNHTLRATDFRESGSNRTVEYRGGVMRGAYAPHPWNDRSKVTAIFNGTDFSGTSFEMFDWTMNSRLVLTNHANVVVAWNGGNLSALFTTQTNNLAEVLDGSTLKYNRPLWLGYGTAAAKRLNSKLLVSGAGSTLDLSPSSNFNFYFGVDQGGSALVVENGAQFLSYNFYIGGAGSVSDNGSTRPGNGAAGGNELIVRGERTVAQITQSSRLGYGSSHSNAIHVLDHAALNIGERTGGTWANLTVGSGPADGVASSYNEIVVSNASLVAREVVFGQAAASHDNRLEFLGPEPELFYTEKEQWKMFGAGFGNVVHVGCGANFSFLTNNVSFGTGGGADNRLVVDGGSVCKLKNLTVGDSEHPFTRNAIEVIGGSCLTNSGNFAFVADRGRIVVDGGSTFDMGQQALFCSSTYETVSNSIFVGSGSLLTARVCVPSQTSVSYPGLELVVSNGTLAVGDADYSRYFKLNGGALVLKGSSPKVCSRPGAMPFYMTHPARICFELPPEGYAEAPLTGIQQLQHSADFELEVVGIEELQKNLQKPTTFTLIETMCDSGLYWMRTLYPEVLERANASLPDGCWLSIDTAGGVHKLKLRVRALTGMTILFR